MVVRGPVRLVAVVFGYLSDGAPHPRWQVGMDPELAQILEEESRHNFKSLGIALGTWLLVAICEVRTPPNP